MRTEQSRRVCWALLRGQCGIDDTSVASEKSECACVRRRRKSSSQGFGERKRKCATAEFHHGAAALAQRAQTPVSFYEKAARMSVITIRRARASVQPDARLSAKHSSSHGVSLVPTSGFSCTVVLSWVAVARVFARKEQVRLHQEHRQQRGRRRSKSAACGEAKHAVLARLTLLVHRGAAPHAQAALACDTSPLCAENTPATPPATHTAKKKTHNKSGNSSAHSVCNAAVRVVNVQRFIAACSRRFCRPPASTASRPAPCARRPQQRGWKAASCTE